MIRIYTDEFLTYTLHYELAEGWDNEGDGHCWIFDSSRKELIKQQIIINFMDALDKLFDNVEEYKEEEDYY